MAYLERVLNSVKYRLKIASDGLSEDTLNKLFEAGEAWYEFEKASKSVEFGHSLMCPAICRANSISLGTLFAARGYIVFVLDDYLEKFLDLCREFGCSDFARYFKFNGDVDTCCSLYEAKNCYCFDTLEDQMDWVFTPDKVDHLYYRNGQSIPAKWNFWRIVDDASFKSAAYELFGYKVKDDADGDVVNTVSPTVKNKGIDYNDVASNLYYSTDSDDFYIKGVKVDIRDSEHRIILGEIFRLQTMVADLKASLTCDVNAETLAVALKSVLDGYNVNPKFKGAEKGNKRAKKRALSDEEILKRRAAGESVHSIATACGVSDMAIYKFLGKGK